MHSKILASSQVQFDFEDGTLQGFSHQVCGNAKVFNSTAHAYTGIRSLGFSDSAQGVGDWSCDYETTNLAGLTPGTVVTTYVYSPTATSGTSFELFTYDGAWNAHYSNIIYLVQGWNTISWTVPQQTGINGFGIQYNNPNGWVGEVDIDTISWGGSASPTPSPVATSTPPPTPVPTQTPTPIPTPTPTPSPTPLSTSAPAYMTIISNKMPVYASSTFSTSTPANNANTPFNLTDPTNNTAYDIENYHNWQSAQAPTTSSPEWISYDLSSVPSVQRGKVDVIWFNNTNAFQCCSIASGGTLQGLPQNYTIEANASPGGTQTAPTTGWVSLTTVTNNSLRVREHVVDLTGYNWVRFNITQTNNNQAVQISHLDVYDLSKSGGIPQDSFAFYGDSITLGATNYADVYYGSPDNFTFASLINSQLPQYFPAETDGGIVGENTSDGLNYFDSWLSVFPGRYVDISYGTNDAAGSMTPAQYYTNMQSLVQKVINAGKVPMVPKIPWTANISYNSGASTTNRTTGKIYTFNQQIDLLYTNYPQIIKGPDFYNFFFDNQNLLNGDVHPDNNGYGKMRTMWACQALLGVYQVAPSTVTSSTMCNPYTSYLPSSSSTPKPSTTPTPIPTNTPTPIATPTAAPSPTLTPTPTPSTTPSAGIALDTSTTISTSGKISPTTWSHTVTSTGTNTILVISVTNRNVCTSALLTGVTYNNIPLTKLSSLYQSSAAEYNEIWYLINPPSGAHPIAISYSNDGCEYLDAVASSWTGVNQVTPFGTPVTSSQTTFGGTQTITVNNTSFSDVIIDSITMDSNITVSGSGGTTNINYTINNYQQKTPGVSSSTPVNFITGSYSDWSILAVPMHRS